MKLPTNRQHTFICGKTGTGKSVFAAWLLGRQDFRRPTVIIDIKRDPIWADLARVGAATIQRKAPFKRPRSGIAIIQSRASVDDEALENLLWSIHRKGKTTLFIDEAYLLPRNSIAMQNILTQGRSKSIQCITCAQKPYYISTFHLSESSFFAIFRLDFKRDQDRVREFVDLPSNYQKPPLHHCYWADANSDKPPSRLLPCPSPRHIVAEIADKAPMPLW